MKLIFFPLLPHLYTVLQITVLFMLVSNILYSHYKLNYTNWHRSSSKSHLEDFRKILDCGTKNFISGLFIFAWKSIPTQMVSMWVIILCISKTLSTFLSLSRTTPHGISTFVWKPLLITFRLLVLICLIFHKLCLPGNIHRTTVSLLDCIQRWANQLIKNIVLLAKIHPLYSGVLLDICVSTIFSWIMSKGTCFYSFCPSCSS